MMPDKRAFIIVDLGYGDAGKGTMVDFLTRQHKAHTIVRYNGGAQAAHNVVTPDGRHHTFSQFGSGIFVKGVQTYLSQHMLIEPYAMFNEENHLQQLGVKDAFARTFIHRKALIITPYQVAANRLRELARGKHRHGSCGMGIGETVSDYLQYGGDVLVAGDLPDPDVTRKKLCFLRDAKFAAIESDISTIRHTDSAQPYIAMFGKDDPLDSAVDNYRHLSEQIHLVDDEAAKQIFERSGTIIFEGAQGVLLDEDYGFAPYNTWSKTTTTNALDMLNENNYDGDVTTLGVIRTYATRHGAGPLVTESTTLSAALQEPHNITSDWQEHFRVGYFDVVATRYALDVTGGVDALVVTHDDKITDIKQPQLCSAYQTQDDVRTLTPYFEHDARHITAIKVKSPPDIAHQTRLAQHLFQCDPVYTGIQGDYLDAIAAALGLPIAIVSRGVTANDKTYRAYQAITQ